MAGKSIEYFINHMEAEAKREAKEKAFQERLKKFKEGDNKNGNMEKS